MCLAIPGRITELISDAEFVRVGKVSFGGIVKEINLSYVPEAAVGDYVIVHVGVAISRVDEREAQKVFEYLEELGEVEELMSQ